MVCSIDDIDKRVIYHLMKDARNVSAPTIADEADVSDGTIRNRIQRLEDEAIIRGYHAHIDYEQIDGMLICLFVCSASILESGTPILRALDVPGVVNVRDLMPGRENFHVEAVGTDTNELMRIATALSKLGLEIEHGRMIQQEFFRPYQPFGPEEEVSP